MTGAADVELLPLYAELQGHPKLEIVKHYTRANVAHATAPLQAEIEALRVEVRYRDASLGWWGRFASDAVNARKEAEARAERLAEALRDAADDIDAGVPPEDVAAHLRARADLLREQEEGHEQ